MTSIINVLLTSLFLLCNINVIFGTYPSSKSSLTSKEKINSDYKYYISVCTLFKDEAPYLKEWIEYHKLIGVEHFRLYNNDSVDNYLEVLEPYIKSGEVVLVDWPGGHGDWVSKVQGPGFLDAVSHLTGISRWLAIIDVDEFILPTEANDLVSFLQDYESYPAVVINWLNYGTSWVQDVPPDKLSIEVLTLRAEEQTFWNSQVKSIVRPECVDTSKQATSPHLLTPHQWCYLNDMKAVAPNKNEFLWGPIDVSKIRINHYVHRTENYLYNCKLPKKSRMEWGSKNYEEFVERWRVACNQVEDKAIFRFVPALREIMFDND